MKKLKLREWITDEIVSTDTNDGISKNVIADWLRARGYNVRFTKRSAPFDLYAVSPTGDEYLIELKAHPYTPSTKYPDNTCEYKKYQTLTSIADPDQIILISLWNDNKLKVSYFNYEHEVKTMRWNKTSTFANRELIDKQVLMFTEYKIIDLNWIRNQ